MTPEQTAPGTRPTRLKVVTFNTWKCDGEYALRLEAMSQQMQALDADVFALQECFATLDGGTDTARSLAHSLGIHLHTAPARRKRRQFQGGWVDSFSSLAVLSRWPIRTGEALELPSSLADGGRVAQLCSMEVAGHTLLLANAHLSHLLPPEGGAQRTQQLRTVLNRLTQMSRHDLTLVCGDFNASMDSFELATFMQLPWGLVDAFAHSGGGEKFTCHTTEGKGLNLDHILCVPSCSRVSVRCVEATVVLNTPAPPGGVMPSDHAGASVTLALG